MKILLQLLLLVTCFSAMAQNTTDDQIAEIRSRFYGLNKVELTQLNIDGAKYYFHNDKLRKVVHEHHNQVYEYYFDLEYISDHAYFIYTIALSDKAENRYYFGKDKQLIRWLDPGKKEVYLDEDGACVKNALLTSLATDVLTRHNNYRLNQKHPNYSEMVKRIDMAIDKFPDFYLQKDTVEVDNVPDEYYYSHKVEFRDQTGIRRKFLSFTGGDHGSETTTSYYDRNGNLIYEHQESGDVFGHSNARHVYWTKGKIFRTIDMSTVRDPCSNRGEFEHTFVPKISDY